jgi:hypothetical protein
MSRLETDQGYDTRFLYNDLADRGVYDSTFTPYLRQRDIEIPYGRERQDINIEAARQLSDIAAQQGEAQLTYNQGLTDIYGGLAGRQVQNPSLAVPGGQFAGRGRRRRRNRRGRR